jgi:bidirectional [NiFe] hydrogenase diaphorase subunit
MMRTNPAKIAPPSDDKRWRLVTATMRRHGYEVDALIETLHSVQEAFGYLDDIALRFVARNLGVPLSHIYGVATFYNFFNLKPQGDHVCVVCMGTACYIKGIPSILTEVERACDLKLGDTSADNKVSLLAARCLGACGMAPAFVFDGEVAGHVSPQDAVARIKEWLEK